MKIALSIPDELFESGETLSRRLGVSRSRLYATALAEFVAKHRGRKVTVRLNAVYGSEDSRLHTVAAVVLSTNVRLVDAPGNVLLPAKATGLPKDSVANVSQVITVDRDFLMKRAGRVRGQFLEDVENGLRLVLGL